MQVATRGAQSMLHRAFYFLPFQGTFTISFIRRISRPVLNLLAILTRRNADFTFEDL